MYRILLQAMVASLLLGFGTNLSELLLGNPHVQIRKLRAVSLEVVKVRWRPISVFPEEATRFTYRVSRRNRN